MFKENSFLSSIPPVVKNLIILNVLFYLASLVLPASAFHTRLEDYMGLHVLGSDQFNPFQLITYMFLHAYRDSTGIVISHLFFNMFSLYMFGRMLEYHWGSKRFLIYYLITGAGAGIIQLAVQYYQLADMTTSVTHYLNNANPETLNSFIDSKFQATSYEAINHFNAFKDSFNQMAQTDPARALALSKQWISQYQIDYYNSFVTVGASGAIFGVLLAFGMTFPDMELMLLFPPIPIKAKFLVIIYIVIELFMGMVNFQFDNVAHWAHLGGMLFGFVLLMYWRKNNKF